MPTPSKLVLDALCFLSEMAGPEAKPLLLKLAKMIGEKQWITRKGAIEMKVGQLGIIPGSMGTRSYIVEGLGNPDSFNSAPHGAGRRFSRTEARRRFTMEDFDRELAGVEVNRSVEFIDDDSIGL